MCGLEVSHGRIEETRRVLSERVSWSKGEAVPWENQINQIILRTATGDCCVGVFTNAVLNDACGPKSLKRDPKLSERMQS